MVLIQLILYYFLMTLFRETRLLENKLNIDRSTLIFISITVECFLHKVLIYKFFSRYSVLLKVTLLSLSEFFFICISDLLMCILYVWGKTCFDVLMKVRKQWYSPSTFTFAPVIELRLSSLHMPFLFFVSHLTNPSGIHKWVLNDHQSPSSHRNFIIIWRKVMIVDQRVCNWVGVYVSPVVVYLITWTVVESKVLGKHQINFALFDEMCNCCLYQAGLMISSLMGNSSMYAVNTIH